MPPQWADYLHLLSLVEELVSEMLLMIKNCFWGTCTVNDFQFFWQSGGFEKVRIFWKSCIGRKNHTICVQKQYSDVWDKFESQTRVCIIVQWNRGPCNDHCHQPTLDILKIRKNALLFMSNVSNISISNLATKIFNTLHKVSKWSQPNFLTQLKQAGPWEITLCKVEERTLLLPSSRTHIAQTRTGSKNYKLCEAVNMVVSTVEALSPVMVVLQVSWEFWTIFFEKIFSSSSASLAMKRELFGIVTRRKRPQAHIFFLSCNTWNIIHFEKTKGVI